MSCSYDLSGCIPQEDLLCTLRVYALERLDDDRGVILEHLCKMGYGLWLVLLYSNDVFLGTCESLEYLDTLLDMLCILNHGAVVCGAVWLALGAVDKDGLNLVFSKGLPLSMKRIGCSSKTNDA